MDFLRESGAGVIPIKHGNLPITSEPERPKAYHPVDASRVCYVSA